MPWSVPTLLPWAPSGPAKTTLPLLAAGTDARGEYTAQGFVVLKGPKGRAQIARAFEHPPFAQRPNALLAPGRNVVEGDGTVFTEAVLFASPSGASAVVCAAASNVWLDWKTARGETLSEVKRGG